MKHVSTNNCNSLPLKSIKKRNMSSRTKCSVKSNNKTSVITEKDPKEYSTVHTTSETDQPPRKRNILSQTKCDVKSNNKTNVEHSLIHATSKVISETDQPPRKRSKRLPKPADSSVNVLPENSFKKFILEFPTEAMERIYSKMATIPLYSNISATPKYTQYHHLDGDIYVMVKEEGENIILHIGKYILETNGNLVPTKTGITLNFADWNLLLSGYLQLSLQHLEILPHSLLIYHHNQEYTLLKLKVGGNHHDDIVSESCILSNSQWSVLKEMQNTISTSLAECSSYIVYRTVSSMKTEGLI